MIVFLLGLAVLIMMAVAAHSLAYFPGDITVSHAAQAYQSAWLDTFLSGVSWLGFPPQSDVLFGLIVVTLFALGARWAAMTEAIAAMGSGGLYLLLQLVVAQPRPTADLVRVAGPVQLTSFPSGHLATFTAVFGLLAYLGFRRLQSSPARWVPVVATAVFLALMGFARLYSGQHWASDILAGCLLGALWLVAVIRIYVWGQGRHWPMRVGAPRMLRWPRLHGPAA